MEEQEHNSSALKIEQLLTPQFLVESLKVTKGTLDSWRRKFGLPFVRLGARIYFLQPDFMEWVSSRRERLGQGPREEATL